MAVFSNSLSVLSHKKFMAKANNPKISRSDLESPVLGVSWGGRKLKRDIKAMTQVGLEGSESLRKLEALEGNFELDVVSERDLREKGFLGMRKTKLVCTIGPACSSMEDLERLALGGMSVARLNMCHNTRDWHCDVIRKIKSLNREKGFCVSIMIDTEGSQVHVIDHGASSSVKAEEGSVWLFTAVKFDGSRPFTVQTNYEGFSEGIEVGDELVIDGGMARFEVVEKVGNDLRCKCSDSGLFLPGAKFSFWRNSRLVDRNYDLPTLSDKDWADIEFGVSEGIDFVAMSFVNDAKSISHLKNYLSTKSSRPVKVLAKIESLESLHKVGEIVEASDGIMVARGDLGVEIPLEKIPMVQEEIVHICRQLNKPVIVASQLLESMVEYPTPTRAEVADISEAVRQCTDALMLSGESAIGLYGHKALGVLEMSSSRIEQWSRGEDQRRVLNYRNLGISLTDRIAEEICNSAVEIANKIGVDAIFVYTKYGKMASLLSRNRPNPPIFAFTDDESTRMAMNLQWGVTSILVDDLSNEMEATTTLTIGLVKSKGLLKGGDSVLVVSDVSPLTFQSIQVKTIID